jgi:transketolase
MPEVQSTPYIMGMRDAYFTALYDIFKRDQKCVLISADDGAPTMDAISHLPNQFRNVGIAEQQMIGMACGLALEGRKVWVYAINPFIVFRALEFLKLDMCAMNLPITAIGVGAGFAYDIMGPTHHSVGSIPVLRCWPNLVIYSVADSDTATLVAELNYASNSPQYVLMDRVGLPPLYPPRHPSFRHGFGVVGVGTDGYIIAHGVMVHQALKVAAALAKHNLSIGVIDLFRIKPIEADLLMDTLENSRGVITLEEEYLGGGIGSIMAETFTDHGISTRLLRIGQPDNFVFQLGGREAIWRKSGLDLESIEKRILEWL